jgi:mRNA interferase YafQ
MLSIIFSSKFTKDYKILKKNHYNTERVKVVIELISNKKILPYKYKNHFLKGEWKHYQECHIETDLLLIYRVENNNLILYRIAKHDDVF